MTGWPPVGISPVQYEPQIVSEQRTREGLAEVRACFVAAYDPEQLPPMWDDMLAAIDKPAVVALYVKCVPLVARLIGAELDTETPGKRGLGRLSPSPPRLGARFRRKIRDADVQRELGGSAERVVLGGYGAAAGLYQSRRDGPPGLRERSEQEIWRLWVPQAYAGLRGVAALDAITEKPRTEFVRVARKVGLTGPIAWRKKLSLALIAHFYAAAGAALYEVNTDLVDHLEKSAEEARRRDSGESAEKTVRCQECGRGFKTATALAGHARDVHE